MNMSITQQFNNFFSHTGESGVVYCGYFNTGEGKELVAINVCFMYPHFQLYTNNSAGMSMLKMGHIT